MNVRDRDRRAAPFIHAIFAGFPLLCLLAAAVVGWAARNSDLALGWSALVAPAPGRGPASGSAASPVC